jgi:soluble lytic murein transglycosylase-like protein
MPKTQFALSVLAGLTLLVSLHGRASAEAVFKHRDANGTVVFSDVPRGEGLQRTAYSNDFGRPTATASCAGLNGRALEERARQWRPQIARAAEHHGLDTDLLVALVRVESCFDVTARSRAGAQGLTQLMPKTARSLGVYDSFDATANLDGGARYLARMLARFGNETLALAAYNAGPGNVDKYGGIPPFPETQNYVKRIAALR